MPSTLTAAVVLLVVVVIATGAGLVWRSRNGRVREQRDGGLLTASDLGVVALGRRATLVQFSTVFCQPCRAARMTLDEVTTMVEGVTHVEVDAESNLELVRRLDIMRTPTVLVLDDRGRIVKRASGAPRKADVVAALGEAVPSSSRPPSR